VITDARGKHPRVLVRNAPVSGVPGTRPFAWSPDGRRLAYLGSTTLYIANADGSDSHPVTADEVTDFAWSPNSQRVALISYGNVATVGADGTGLNAIPELQAGGYRGVYWSPDSTRIAVAPAIASVATGDVVRLPIPILVDITLMWSPDGSMLVTGDSLGSGGLYLISGDGSTYTHVDSCQP
jgi:Tol biopolymer transport system component